MLIILHNNVIPICYFSLCQMIVFIEKMVFQNLTLTKHEGQGNFSG